MLETIERLVEYGNLKRGGAVREALEEGYCGNHTRYHDRGAG